jgi:hypothetical protein
MKQKRKTCETVRKKIDLVFGGGLASFLALLAAA